MELVRKIKEAEAEAVKIVEDARKKALEDKNQAVAEAEKALEEEKKRKNSLIEQAISQAIEQGKADVDTFIQQADKERDALVQQCKDRIEKCAREVVGKITDVANQN